MSLTYLKLAYLAGVAVFIAIRSPYQRQWKSNVLRDDRQDVTERILLVAMLLTLIALPLVSLVTPLLAFAEYRPPAWVGPVGVASLWMTGWLFWRSHRDLSANWSPTLQVREGHELITSGVYAYVRHPMYAAIWLWALSQALLVQNWLAGPPSLVVFGLMYVRRRVAEEEMMLEQFGEAYRSYAARTPPLFPRIRRN